MTSPAQENQYRERRRHTRFETRFEIEIRSPDKDPANYQIRDFCREGVLISALDDPSPPVSAGDKLELYHVESPAHLALRIPIQVVRLTMNGFGAVFKAPQAEILALLQLLDGKPRPTEQKTASPTLPDATQWSTLIRGLADSFAQARLEVIFSAMLKRCVDSIQDRLHQIPTNQSYQETILDTARLQQAQKNVSQSLTIPLVAQIENNVTRSTPLTQTDVDDSELSLVDMKLFEHWLEAAKVATLLEDLFKSPLQLIETKVLQIFPQCGSNPPPLPFNPRQFTDFLNEFTEQGDFGDFARTEFFLSARDVLSRQLGSFYEELVRNFPDTTASDGRESPLPPTESTPAEPSAEANPALETTEPPGPDNVKSIEPNNDGVSPDIPHRLAQRLTQTDGNKEVKAVLQHELANLNLPQHLAARTQQRGELAGQLLESFADSNIGVAGSAHDWLQALQPSIAEAVIQNPAFMQQRTDPLRGLIDELDHLGTLLPSSDQRDGEQRAALTVEALLKKTVGDAGAVPEKFASTLTHVEQLTDRMSQRYQRNVERVITTSTGRYRLKQAQRKVGVELNRRYTGHLVPKIVPRLLDNCWYAFLTLDALRLGEQNIGKGKPWETLEALIQHLQGQPYQHLDPLPVPHDVFSELEKGLNDASFDPIERDNFVSDLHELVLGMGTSPKDLQNFTPYDLTTPAPQKPSDDIADADWATVLESIDALQAGDDVLLHTEGQPPQKIRLVWKSDDGEDFALVDQRGIRALETNRQDFAHSFQSGKVTIEKTDRRDLSKRLVDDLLLRLEDRLGTHKEHDTLTGLLNRGSFKPLLEKALTTPKEHRRPVLVWIEIDKLKMISSSLGFEAGDFILVKTARLLCQLFNESDKLAYLGGDQFAALIFGSAADHTMSLANSFCKYLSEHPITWKETKLPICAGVGVIDLADVDGDVLHLIGLATKSVAMSRRAGCNRAYQYVASEPETIKSSDSMESLIYVNRILEHGRLRLRAQKIIHVDDSETPAHHHEILLGVQDENDNAVNIGHFIAAAEAHNLMGLVDRWVTTEAIRWVGKNPVISSRLGGIAINLSGQSMSDRSFVAFVRELMAEHEVSPTFVSFEVTETAAIGSFGDARANIQALKNMGCRCALDDFGTGLSSYEYLRELPVDYLKIDGSFVKNIANNKNDYAVVRSMNEIGQFMGKKTIAEYVINADVLQCLRTIGVDYAQGFGIHEPRYLDLMS